MLYKESKEYKGYKCIICKDIIRESEYDTGIINFCICQVDIDSDFNNDNWMKGGESDDTENRSRI